jgi:hypothetical protein
MALTRGFARNAATTPLDARLMDDAQIVCNVGGAPRPGVLRYDPNLVTALATMNVAVAANEFVTTKGAADGVFIFTNDGTVNVAIAAAPASNSRIDVIWVKHNDNTTGDANSTPVFGVTAGAAAATPTKPAIPTGALELATLRVYAGTTAANGGTNTLVNTYQMTASRGGVVNFRTKAELDLWTTANEGQDAYVIGTKNNYRFDGAKWVLNSRSLVSAVTSTTQSIPNSAATDVVFPAGATTIVSLVGADMTFAQGTGVVTVAEAGVYEVRAGIVWAAGGSSASHYLMASKNNSNTGAGQALATLDVIAGQIASQRVQAVFECAAGDTLRVKAFQGSGAAKAIGVAGAAYYQTMTVERIA